MAYTDFFCNICFLSVLKVKPSWDRWSYNETIIRLLAVVPLAKQPVEPFLNKKKRMGAKNEKNTT